MLSDSEEQLVLKAQEGDGDSFGELARRHRSRIVALAARLLGDVHKAEDVAQDSLRKAMVSLGQLREPDRFGAWLTAIVLNECRQLARQGLPVALPVPEDHESSTKEPSDELNLGAVLAATASRMMDLPPKQCAAASLFYFHGLSYGEIAGLLDTTAAGVQSLLERARAKLRLRREGIFDEGAAIMEGACSHLDHVVSTPELVIERLSLGDHRWGTNQVSVWVQNPSGKPLYLELDVRACVSSGHTMNWQRQWWHEVGPGEERELTEPYVMMRIFSPWYAVFRGPGIAKVRVTFARLSEDEFRKRLYFMDNPATAVFQKWFEVVVPADSQEKGVPVKPVLPAARDITLDAVKLGPRSPGEHEMLVTLHNHTSEERALHIHVQTPTRGQGADHVLTPEEPKAIPLRYFIHQEWQRYLPDGELGSCERRLRGTLPSLADLLVSSKPTSQHEALIDFLLTNDLEGFKKFYARVTQKPTPEQAEAAAKEIYGKPLQELEAEWHRWLKETGTLPSEGR
jgi:RNA polymerase sigma-70 factor (ECF subfamily)